MNPVTEIKLDHLRPAVKVGMFGETSELWGREVNFVKGSHYLLKSRSGMGKTSALSFIYGLRKDFTGDVLFDNRNTAGFSYNQWSSLRRNSLSILFQDLRLFRQLSAMENVLLKHTMGSSVSTHTIDELFERFNMTPLINKSVGTLSFGEQQRVAIIRSVVQPFDFLLMDEPFSHIDRQNTGIALEIITEACQNRGASLILTSLDDIPGVPFKKIIEV